MTPSEKLKAELKRRKVQQKVFAQAAGITDRYVRKCFENNELSIDMVMAAARLFPDLDMNWLLRDQENEI